MSDTPLLTLRQIADELGLPESTVRYYRDAFLDRVPFVGTGRRRRYPPEAVAVLRSIAERYAAGQTRVQIAASIDASPAAGRAVAVRGGRTGHALAIDEVTNLDLLAAILDGEREQRDALWRLANEIVRLTDVLAGQDEVLSEIADRAGVPSAPRLSAGNGRGAVEGPVASPAEAATEVPTAPAAAPAEPTAGGASAIRGDLDQLRRKLDEERELVERLRNAKLEFERRAADAEAELEERRTRRPSVLRRLLRSDGP